MDRFQEMTVFQAVADEGGFAAAARRLNMSAASVTRAVAGLEARIGALLLVRSTRNLRLTDVGERYLHDCRRILSELVEADDSAAGGHTRPHGMLAVTAPVLFGELYVTPLIADYLALFPDVMVQALLLDRVVSMQEEGIDVGIRIGELPDSSLHAVRVGQVRRVVCAAPSLIALQGEPQHPSALAHCPIIMAANVTHTFDWRFEDAGAALSVRVRPRLSVNTNQAAIAAAAHGLGFTRVLSYQIAAQLQNGSLQLLLERFEPAPLPVHVVYREGPRASAKVRSFVDFCVARLRAHGALGANPVA